MLEEMLFIFFISWFTPVSWLVLVLTVIASFFIRRLWIVSTIILPVSVLLFIFLMPGRDRLLSLDMNDLIQISIFVTVSSIFIVWIGRIIAKKLGLSFSRDEQNDKHSNGHIQ